ncbi:hypothetical protein J31TS6_25920 [Brevibacillus reuszeri]|nr:hypothetical protein J31TS6_25920 [Brevibacillus reuszeri]
MLSVDWTAQMGRARKTVLRFEQEPLRAVPVWQRAEHTQLHWCTQAQQLAPINTILSS